MYVCDVACVHGLFTIVHELLTSLRSLSRQFFALMRGIRC